MSGPPSSAAVLTRYSIAEIAADQYSIPINMLLVWLGAVLLEIRKEPTNSCVLPKSLK
ncbi:hypothetical protein D3C73_1654630 [compost metagenome]